MIGDDQKGSQRPVEHRLYSFRWDSQLDVAVTKSNSTISGSANVQVTVSRKAAGAIGG